MDTLPQRMTATDGQAGPVLELIRSSFAYMAGRIDPPSSIHRMTEADVLSCCDTGEVWFIGHPPSACMILTFKSDCLYLGKLAVAANARGKGLARALIDHAVQRAKVAKLNQLELQTRVELVENHTTFQRLGFVKVAETAHRGYRHATSITMRKPVA